jgi:hypothetical protein
MPAIKTTCRHRCKDKAQETLGATAATATATVPPQPVATHKEKTETNRSSRLRNLIDNYYCKEKKPSLNLGNSRKQLFGSLVNHQTDKNSSVK